MNWDRELLEEFKKAYKESEKNNFFFKGQEFSYDYATYLIEYFEGVLK